MDKPRGKDKPTILSNIERASFKPPSKRSACKTCTIIMNCVGWLKLAVESLCLFKISIWSIIFLISSLNSFASFSRCNRSALSFSVSPPSSSTTLLLFVSSFCSSCGCTSRFSAAISSEVFVSSPRISLSISATSSFVKNFLSSSRFLSKRLFSKPLNAPFDNGTSSSFLLPPPFRPPHPVFCFFFFSPSLPPVFFKYALFLASSMFCKCFASARNF